MKHELRSDFIVTELYIGFHLAAAAEEGVGLYNNSDSQQTASRYSNVTGCRTKWIVRLRMEVGLCKALNHWNQTNYCTVSCDTVNMQLNLLLIKP